MIVEVFRAIVMAIAEAIAIVITILIKDAFYTVIGIFKISIRRQQPLTSSIH